MIVGGGLIGLLLGSACAGAGLSVTIIDRQDPRTMLGERFDGRTSAIAYGSRCALEALGLWPQIADHAQPILEIRVADDGSPLFLHYDYRDLADARPLGYIVENRVLRQVLIDHIGSLESLSFVAPFDVDAVETTAFAAIATLSDGRKIAARLIAAADGRDSRLRRNAGVRTVEWRYSQTGIVTTVQHEHSHCGIAVEHFLPAGPFAILPMIGNRSRRGW
jgi:2-octaprenyl-6-methoxyphenol hydroxylase